VTLLSFSGRPVQNGIRLQWKTDNESNLSHFDIQRSTDGANYISIGTVAASNTGGVHEYTYTDAITLDKTINYRLKQIDVDARFNYSAVVVFSGNQKIDGLSVYPNPVVSQANLTIRLSQSANTSFSLLDNSGKLIRKWKQDLQAGSTAMTISMEGLAAGLYYLELKGSNSQQRIKLIKQ
jgi:hypothetical protein